MAKQLDESRLISHENLAADLQDVVDNLKSRLIAEGDKPYVTVEEQITLLTQLTEFEFGRFLLLNRGINGYWTHYMLTYPWVKDSLKTTELEHFILARSPAILATQERFKIFLRENQKFVKNNARLACIPSGMLGELLYLDFKGIDSILLTGIDYDGSALELAKELAIKKGLGQFAHFIRADAWELGFKNEFDLISSNGLNIYEPSDVKVIELYKQFYLALKPGGTLVTSYLTPPPTSPDCEWQMDNINQQDLLLQKIIFVDILNVKWQCFRSSEETKDQLHAAGFSEIEFICDQAKMFPTVVAKK